MSAHQLLRFTQSIHNEPHLITQQAFRTITEYLDSRNRGEVNMVGFGNKQQTQKPSYDVASSVAVLQIMGSLSYRETSMSVECGLTTYEGLVRQAHQALSAGVKTIVLMVDSGGGMAQGCFDCANELRSMADEAGASIYTYIDGRSCSAAYAFSCIADYVVAQKDSEVGSIGVLISLVDDSKQMEKEGIKIIYITDGASKVPFDESGAFKQDFLDELQVKATKLGDAFREHVAGYTGMSVQDLKDTQAKVFDAPEALSLGFINAIMTKNEFVDYVLEQMQGAKNA